MQTYHLKHLFLRLEHTNICFDSSFFHFRTGIKHGVDWLVEEMERSKRTEALRARTEAAGKI